MTVGELVYSALTASLDVSFLVGTRIFPQVLQAEGPDGLPQLPAIAYHVITDKPTRSLDNESRTLRRVHVQVDCYALEYLAAQAVADAVEGALLNFSAQGLTAAEATRRDLYEEDAKWFRVALDFSWMWLKEA